jgi:hypothetical protein
MSTTEITWVIEKIQALPVLGEHTNVIQLVNWRATAKKDTYTSTTYGAVQLPPPTNGFIPLENLTEAQVIQWVKDALGTEQLAFIETDLNNMLEAQINPPIITPALPWAIQTTQPIVPDLNNTSIP